jgi:hypothetical protein
MQKALAPEISTWPDDNPQLVGSKCVNCGASTISRATALSEVQQG